MFIYLVWSVKISRRLQCASFLEIQTIWSQHILMLYTPWVVFHNRKTIRHSFLAYRGHKSTTTRPLVEDPTCLFASDYCVIREQTVTLQIWSQENALFHRGWYCYHRDVMIFWLLNKLVANFCVVLEMTGENLMHPFLSQRSHSVELDNVDFISDFISWVTLVRHRL